MKALTYLLPSEPSEQLRLSAVNIDPPTPAEGEVLVRVHFAGLSEFDLENYGGKRNKAIARALKKGPVISGIEMSGVVDSNGQQFSRGDKVVAYTNIWRGPFYHAQLVAVPESNLVLIPDNHSLEGAASIVGGALTSINALERIAKLAPDDSILITGATGSVGVTALQLASHVGAKTSAVCHSSRMNFALSQGAKDVYAYDNQELPPASNQFNVVLDAAPSLSFSRARCFLVPRGLYIPTMPHLDVPGYILSLITKQRWGYLMENKTERSRMDRLGDLMADDAFAPIIDSIHPLASAELAFKRQCESGKRGKILIDFR
ncbi:MAG: NAD(P)-dependent alcohol dehydrogenase [Pseudomonadota bacterium]